MRIHHIYRPAVALCVLLWASAALAQSSLPPNLHLPSLYREVVESIAGRSATFREQLVRIAAEPRVTINLVFVPRIIGARAKTRMVVHIDELDAHIEVAYLENIVELIAHEFEHVIEQMEGMNFAVMSDAGDPGISSSVSASGDNVFETKRAARAGVSVAREVRASLRNENSHP